MLSMEISLWDRSAFLCLPVTNQFTMHLESQVHLPQPKHEKGEKHTHVIFESRHSKISLHFHNEWRQIGHSLSIGESMQQNRVFLCCSHDGVFVPKSSYKTTY